MEKVTFLFGAGASCNALPLVKEIPKRLDETIILLENEKFNLEGDNNWSKSSITIDKKRSLREYQLELISLLKHIKFESEKHASIDTYAKKLTIREKRIDLEELKIALSVFFTIEQAIKKPDYRYDAFLASLLDETIHVSSNVKILSWNYDNQFEISFSQYSGYSEIKENYMRLGVVSKEEKMNDARNLGIYKLNGTVGLFNNNKLLFYTGKYNKTIDKSFIKEVVMNFAIARYGHNFSALSFAWEPETYNSSIERIANIVFDTSVLVVIGYSFPYFNRDIDRKIIGKMNLKKVYFQAPDADALKERFQSIRNDIPNESLIPIYDKEQFFLPNEL